MDELEENNINKTSDQQSNNDFKSTSLKSRPQNRKETNGEQKKKKPKEKVNCYRRIQSASAIIMALCTLAIAGITAFYTHYASQQVEQMSNTVTEMQKQSISMQNAADANKKAVDLAERNIKATQEQSRLDQRAWIGGVEATPPPFTDGTSRVYIKEGERIPIIGIVIINSGKTPARKIKTVQQMRAFANNIFKPVYVSDSPIKKSISVLHPGGRDTLPITPFDIIITKEMINEIRSGKIVLYIYGKITYEDIFGRGHRTTFCHFIDKDMKAIANCDTYNDAN